MPSLIITDLDGTILPRGGEVSPEVHGQFDRWRNAGHVVGIATGRNFHSLRKALRLTFPIDFAIFSSGQGIVTWPSQKMTICGKILPAEAAKIAAYLYGNGISFMQHHCLPHSHRFRAFTNSGVDCPDDFGRRLKIYRNEHTLFHDFKSSTARFETSQFISILDSTENPDLFMNNIKLRFPDYSVIRATSPLDDQSHWIEIFPNKISKANAAENLRTQIGCAKAQTFAIGNDWNDESLLSWAQNAWLVTSAPEALLPTIQRRPLLGQDGIIEKISSLLV